MVHITEEGPKEDLLDLERPSLESSIDSSVVPPEEGIGRYRDKEYKETPLPILPSVRRGITVTEAGISTLFSEGIEVNNDNEPSPDNSMQSDDVFTTPLSLTFGFHGLDPWRQSGNFPVGRARLKMTPNPRIKPMSRLDFFI